MTALGDVMAATVDRFARQTLEDEILRIRVGAFDAPTDEDRAWARAKVAQIEADGKLYDVLEATAPRPCPECGR